MKLIFEKFYPYLFGLISAAIWYQLSLDFPSKSEVISSTLSVSGVFVGFLATSKAILISTNSKILSDLRSSGYINELVSYIGEAIWINLAFCTFDVIGYFVETTNGMYGVIWIGIAVTALASFIRVTHIMLSVFKHG